MKDISRAEAYQFKFHEITYSPLPAPSGLGDFPSTKWERITNRFSMQEFWDYQARAQAEIELLLLLDGYVKDAMWQLIRDLGTPFQLNIMEKIQLGWTQQEIADELDINQSNICKALTGNVVYLPTGGKKYQGGIRQKIVKHMRTYRPLWEAMQAIYKVDETAPMVHYQTMRRAFGSFQEFTRWMTQDSPSGHTAKT